MVRFARTTHETGIFLDKYDIIIPYQVYIGHVDLTKFPTATPSKKQNYKQH